VKPILIVDDDAIFNDLLNLTLSAAGYKVFSAQDGVEGWEILRKEGPMTVVLDLHMPRMDGKELTRRIRADARLRQVPIMMLSVQSEVETQVSGYEYGADDYLIKPFEVKILLARLSALERGTPPPSPNRPG
jgi:DNA-binding response OmpR family regulator